MVFFTDITALGFWRWVASTESKRPKTTWRNLRLPNAAPDTKKALEISKSFESRMPLEILVFDHKHRRNSSTASCMVSKAQFPRGSFLKISEDIYVVNPHLLFLSLARRISLIELVNVGYQLTAKYAFLESSESDFATIDPITTPAHLRKYLGRMGSYKGINKANRASRFILGGSESPMETKVAMTLTLPRRIGGFGLPLPKMGFAVPIERSAFPEYAGSSVRFDLYWSKGNLDVEYDSTQYHASELKLAEDSKRRNVIRALGYDVITITAAEYASIDSMIRIAKLIAKKIGYRLPSLDREWRGKNIELRRQLNHRI